MASWWLMMLLGCPADVYSEGTNDGDCADEIDNDNDGFTDCDDERGCAEDPACDPTSPHTQDTDTGEPTTEPVDTAPPVTDSSEPPATAPFPSGDEPYDGMTNLQAVSVVCSSSQRWEVFAQTIGWADYAIFNMWRTHGDPWNEEHRLDSIGAGADQWWEQLEVGLADGGPYASGSSTALECGVHDVAPIMTYSVRVYDETGALSDCWVWATDPDGLDAFFSYDDLPDVNTISNRWELAGCLFDDW